MHWSLVTDHAMPARFLEAGRYHGVLPLLDARFRNHIRFESWPATILQACRRATLAQAGYELTQGAEIDRVLTELAHAAIKPLLLKGTGLAYGLYRSPVLRPRSDTDLLVPLETRAPALQTLQQLGYRRVCGPAGKFVGYQLQLEYLDARGIAHNIDLHWRISNAQSFAWLFSFAELSSAAVPVPALNPHASRLGNAHALLLCLLHRAGNNLFQTPGFGDRLIWLYDIHLLVGAMSGAELDHFRAIVEAKCVGAIALDGLYRCDEFFPSPPLAALIDGLARGPGAQSGADLLSAGRLRREWIELSAIPYGAARLGYLAARAFPSGEYMRERFPDSPARALPVLHTRRWIEGLGNLLRVRGH